MQQLSANLTTSNLAEAVAVAALPDQVRGYESLKARRAADYRVEFSRRLEAFAERVSLSA